MAAPAHNVNDLSADIKQIIISPATSNKNAGFTRDFDQLFQPSTAQAAFEQHPAFTAVFRKKGKTFGGPRRLSSKGPLDSTYNKSEADKFPGEIVALSGDSAGGHERKSEVRLSRAPKGLISTIMTAYNQHVNLSISPDDVWLTILAQFCAYVNKNAEGLRDKIVEHEGKKELVVESYGSLRTADYQGMIRELLRLIRQNIKSPELADWFRPGFSTTTERDEVCAAATAMASLQEYFSCIMILSCGIPSVTLRGTSEDWKLLRQKVDRLLEFEVEGNPDGKVMDIWVGYLRKVCDGFVESAEHPDSAETRDFWDKVMSRIGGGSGMSYTTGWICVFNCFDTKGNFLGPDFLGRKPAKYGEYPTMPIEMMCHNVVSCPVTINDNGQEHDGTLFSGQTVCEAERAGEDGHPTVRARNDWCMAVAVKE